MALTAGTKLGPYEVLGALGAGGMGEVYRARNTRLERTVAIKILPEHLASDPGRRARFEREARIVSGLSHPNICALFDLGEQNGIHYVVLEYLEGETLADRLAKGPMPVSEVLKVGADIASALDAARRYGIVHRDLKPANVMLTKTGTKLLDFGVAKPSPALASAAAADTQTLSKSLTEEGVIVGTFRYMAPEQLEGKDTDGRTDIFALGVLLYEMVTGRNAFGGTSRASIIAAIMSSDPAPISTLQPLSPRRRSTGWCKTVWPKTRINAGRPPMMFACNCSGSEMQVRRRESLESKARVGLHASLSRGRVHCFCSWFWRQRL